MDHLEIRSEDDNTPDPLAEATRAVEELRAANEEFRASYDERLASETRGIQERINSLEARLNRPTPSNTRRDPNEPSAEMRAFASYLRHGDRTPADEIRTLIVSGDPQGGYLAPPETSSEFVRNLVEFSPIRSLATVRQTASPSVTYPKRTSVTNAVWKGEQQAQTASEPAFGQAEIPVRELSTYVDISNRLLADSAGVAEAEVRLALAEDFGKKEGTAFVSGAGVLQPEGLLTNSAVPYTFTGNASTLGTAPADKLIDAFYALPAPYRARSTWLMNGTTLATIRKLKDSVTSVYLWQPALTAGQPETILGRPVVEVIDMPDVGSAAEPIILGDIATAYRIVDRVALSVLVNPYLLATTGLTRIHATRLVGGSVLQPAALRKIRCATS